MKITDIYDDLAKNSYPGRGIAVGKTPSGNKAVIAYFIMGRSENSRNRVFVSEGDTIKTQAYDISKVSDPSLIIYSAVRRLNNIHIVTNGNQTDTIYNYLRDGSTFANALRTRGFEPDAPNFTPRISATVELGYSTHFKLSILKSADSTGSACVRFFYEYDKSENGRGYFIHTYNKDGTPLESYSGEPKIIEINENIDEFADGIWNSLNEQNKISLVVRYINIETGDFEDRIINKNGESER